MIASHRHRFVFVKTRKTASTSIELALSRICGPDDVVTPVLPEDEELRASLGGVAPQNVAISSRWRPRDYLRVATGRRPRFFNHMPARLIRRYLPEWDDYLTFTVERNPWDRLASAFRFANQRGRRYTTMADFLTSDEVSRFDNWPLYTIDNRVAVDHIARYEDLDDGLEAIWRKLGIDPGPLPHAKATGGDRPYRDWYDDETTQRVADLYPREINYFGWKF